jgi:HK97 family phage major capsid protein
MVFAACRSTSGSRRRPAARTAYWVGEGAPKPVSAAAFATTTMSFAKVADLVVLTDELIRYSSPSAEELIRNDLTAQIAQFLDVAFIDPSKARMLASTRRA